MNEEMITLEEVEVTEEFENESEESNKGAWIVLGVGAVIVGGIAYFVHKNKAKLEERQVRKLEAKGYVIKRPVEPVEVEVVSEDCEEA